MIPTKYTCPYGWTTVYNGYLMAELFTHYRSQLSCIDKEMKQIAGSIDNIEGLRFFPVEGRCGTLPCSPYEETKELTCVRCVPND